MNYGTLKSYIASEVNRDLADLETEISKWIHGAATLLQNVLNLKPMECSAELDLTVPAAGAYRGEAYAVELPPTGTDWTQGEGPTVHTFKSVRQAWVYDGDGNKLYRMLVRTKDDFERAVMFSSQSGNIVVDYVGDILLRQGNPTPEGYPLIMNHWAGELILFPRATASCDGCVARMDYFGFVDYSAVADDYTDDLITHGWEALQYGACLRGAPYLGKMDDRREEWKAFYSDGVKSLQALSVGQDNTMVR